MKNFVKTIGILLVGMVCCQQSVAQIHSDYNKEIDFSKFKTYSFAGWQNDSDKILNDLDKQRIYDAFSSEFSSRGMEYVESNADAVVTLFVQVEDKTDVTAYTNYVGGYGYNYRWGWNVYPGYGMGGATTTVSERDYKKGTLVIDVYDSETENLAWQGTLVTEVAKPQKREKTTPKKIRKLMKKYPVKPMK